ncbi:GNAT family N-acetyltransferase [Patulibacter minatonensis]|uniref:GNAT family N-acetyltransferase n=1 Tax=Patulibacter minatonensis TaxID=298163 RepID=UPI0004AFA0C8|nr:GNAT family N-acetyltransferase [Patulibacter minatonensis]
MTVAAPPRTPSSATGAVEVRPVRSVADLRRFIDLPYRLHAGTPWIPPLRLERWIFLVQKLNAFFSHGRGTYFLAWRDGRVVGRITAHVDDSYNEHHDARRGLFGFIEFEDDPEVVRALLDAAEAWVRGQGCDRIVGPMDFGMNDECGVLVDGFEREPLVRQPWHPPYYGERLEEAGLTKAVDLLSYWLEVAGRDKVRPALLRMGARAREQNGVVVRPMRMRGLRKELDAFADVYNQAWSENWGYSPFREEDLDAWAFELRLVHSPGWYLIAEKDGEVIGMSVTVMDINQVLKRMKGRLLPFGWLHYLRRHRIVDQLRVGFLGVKPEHMVTGAGAALYEAQYDVGATSPLKAGEAGWILETNKAMNKSLQAMSGVVVKRWRMYERELGEA